ncbi:MAG TPA: DNA primase [Bryobacteraceae bacterium]|nr:DNA primase [Bryobacteraceae bacterium]
MDFAQQLKSQIDIVEVVGERVRLKRMGSSPRYMGLCPFHTEKTGSFSVHAGLQIFICFGCGVKGDVFKFIQEMEHVTFPEALKMLADRFGIDMPKRSEYGDRESRLRDALLKMNEIAQRVYRSALTGSQGVEARSYLAGRGVSLETAAMFGLGLADRTGNTLIQALQKEGFAAEHLEASGLVIQRQEGGFFDRFRGRLIFPIHNEQGKVVGFAGRALAKGDEPKYLNSPETGLYKKHQLLYNLNRAKEAARQRERFILVEGYMDVIGLSTAGISEVVASCGTALSSGQVKLMKRFADQVIVNFDPDTGGSRGAEKSIQVLLDENTRVRILELDQDLDPDEYIHQYGVETYLNLAQRAPNYYFWLADQARKRYDSRTAEGRQQALRFLLPAIQRIPDKIERAGVAGDLASYLGVDRGMILEQFKKAAIDQRARGNPAAPPVPAVERMLLMTLVRHKELREELAPHLERPGLIAEFRMKRVFECLLRLYKVQPDFGYAELEGRLEESDSTLLAGLIFADEMEEGGGMDVARLDALSCLRSLESSSKEVQISDLQRQLREALQRGEDADAMKLAEQLDVLKRQRTRVRMQ